MLRGLIRALGAYRFYERMLRKEIESGPMPRHLALILDGNRRWARSKSKPPWYGHAVGAEKVEEVLKWCLELGIETITLYVLSTENLKREREELEKLLEIIENHLRKALNERMFDEHEVRVRALGRLELLPPSIRDLLTELERKTSRYSRHFLNVAIAYGGRAEIVDAVRNIVRDVRKGKLREEDIDERTFENYLYTSHLPNPYPDLIIRTSGEVRLSNFLLWQSAYSELVFLDVYWPEFRRIDLYRAIRTYQRRSRRFGL